MNHALSQLLAPPRLWLLATSLALGVIALGAAFCPVAETPNAVDNSLVYANGQPVLTGRWSMLCIDGVAYLEISSSHGRFVVPKYRQNGLVARCALPAGR
jgi:hypothetical protein